MKSFTSIIEEGNDIKYHKMLDKVTKLHDSAKDGSLKVNGIKYDFKFNRREGVYTIIDTTTNETETRLNTRKLTQAKKWFKEYMSN